MVRCPACSRHACGLLWSKCRRQSKQYAETLPVGIIAASPPCGFGQVRAPDQVLFPMFCPIIIAAQ